MGFQMNKNEGMDSKEPALSHKDATQDSLKGDILIVDDTPANLRLLSQMLIARGYKVRPVLNGVRALAAVRSTLPDLILLDIMMPEMNGYEVCKRLKADEQTRDIPIIFISALDATEDKVRAFTAGGVDYVTRPFQSEEVLARVETHLSLRNLQKSLQQEIAELDAFAHTVAHDLKNPLGLLIGYGGVLAEELADTQNKTVQECVDAIVRTGAKMTTIIKELLLLAGVRKIDEVTLEPLDMATIVSEVQDRLAALIAEHQTEIILPQEWPVALGYGPWVEQVWSNYISNAVKYGGRPPRVELGADPLPMEGTEGEMKGRYIRFWVRDNGPGLAQEEQGRLFAEFTRLHQVRAEGHGLGLSIVRRIVEKLGGQVGVESQPDRGSTFTFTLPGAR
jgi:two-component system sensor histidine kinase/response regulator